VFVLLFITPLIGIDRGLVNNDELALYDRFNMTDSEKFKIQTNGKWNHIVIQRRKEEFAVS
jgi:hypothetical protein